MVKAGYLMRQEAQPGLSEIEKAISEISQSDSESRGAIYTRREVVDFILDLVGYRSDSSLCEMRLLEPSFGEGSFLTVAVERLLKSYFDSGGRADEVHDRLKNCIYGVELHSNSYQHTISKLKVVFSGFAVGEDSTERLLNSWLRQGDFLLAELEDNFTHVVGNPPYIRQEMIPEVLLSEYRRRFSTIYDRADLYVPFIEKSLNHLKPGGILGFICADRWIKNKYGQRLRSLISSGFRLRVYVDMVGTQAFHSDVSAYPAIFIVGREESGPTRIALRPTIRRPELQKLHRALTEDCPPKKRGDVYLMDEIGTGKDPWLLDRPEELKLVRRLERNFPAIEDAGCKIGIGVATGADKAYIGPFDALDVEADRKLPLVMTRDIQSGAVKSRGLGVINPFRDEGGVVSLDDYPKLKAYLEERKDQIIKRNVATKNPSSWFRTIDRIYPEIASKPKLLIPDIKGDAHIVYEAGEYYPHHNLYYILSDKWELRALQAILQSGIARLFVSVYCTQMRGGYLRFQAQYLRRICIPQWSNIPRQIRNSLISAGVNGDAAECNEVVSKLYGLSADEKELLRDAGRGQ